jgi:hypothetical protein
LTDGRGHFTYITDVLTDGIGLLKGSTDILTDGISVVTDGARQVRINNMTVGQQLSQQNVSQSSRQNVRQQLGCKDSNLRDRQQGCKNIIMRDRQQVFINITFLDRKLSTVYVQVFISTEIVYSCMNLTMALKLGADVQSYTGILTQDPYFNNLIIKGTAHMRFQELTTNFKVIERDSPHEISRTYN